MQRITRRASKDTFREKKNVKERVHPSTGMTGKLETTDKEKAVVFSLTDHSQSQQRPNSSVLCIAHSSLGLS